jgi:hypothetical protein
VSSWRRNCPSLSDGQLIAKGLGFRRNKDLRTANIYHETKTDSKPEKKKKPIVQCKQKNVTQPNEKQEQKETKTYVTQANA